MTSWEFWSFTFFYNSKLLVLAQAAIRVNIYIYCHGGVIGTGQDTAGPLPDLRSPPLPGHPQAAFVSRETNERSVGWCESLHMGNLNSLPALKLTAKASENGWLEYDRFLLGRSIFSGKLLVPRSVSFLLPLLLEIMISCLNFTQEKGF